MRSEIMMALAALICAGCAKTPRGTRPVGYRTPGVYNSRVHAEPIAMPVKSSPKPTSNKPESVIYKRVPTEKDVREAAEKLPPSQPMAKKAPPKADVEKAQLKRLLEMDMITREEFERRMGAHVK